MSGGWYVVDGPLVRRLRRDRLMSQAELGAAAGVGQSLISALEHGRKPLPAWLPAVASALGTGVRDLLVPHGPPGQQETTAAPGRAATYWTTTEVCDYLGLSRDVVYRLAAAGCVASTRAGRALRFGPASVRAYRQDPGMYRYRPRAPAAGVLRVSRQRLRQLRRARGWTQRELARRAGIGLNTVRSLETGHLATSKLPVLAIALGVPVRELMANQPAAPGRVWTVAEAVGLLGVQKKEIWDAIRAGELGIERAGRSVRVHEEQLCAYLGLGPRTRLPAPARHSGSQHSPRYRRGDVQAPVPRPGPPRHGRGTRPPGSPSRQAAGQRPEWAGQAATREDLATERT